MCLPIRLPTERELAELELARLADLRQELVDTASHELRGPLTSILGFSSRLLARADLPADVLEYLGFIRQQAEEIIFRMNLYLGVSEADWAEERVSTPSPEPVMVDLLLRGEVEALRARHGGTPVEIGCVIGLVLASDPHRLSQILANLLDNAAKYGEGWVGVFARYEEHDVVIEVCDDGPGIPSMEAEHVFARGYRTHAAEGSATGGKGFGLFVAREFAERLGGTLTYERMPERGSKFVLRLPVVGEDSAMPAPR